MDELREAIKKQGEQTLTRMDAHRATTSDEIHDLGLLAAPTRHPVKLAVEDPPAPYRIVFMDWKMPGMSGIEAGRAIKALPSPPARNASRAARSKANTRSPRRCR